LQAALKPKTNFFISVWYIFLLLLIAYAAYLFLESGELALHLKPDTDRVVQLTSFRIITGLFFFIAVVNITKISGKKLWVTLIIAAGFVTRIMLIPTNPVLEDDYFRYLWDGAVTANGINPYYYSPGDAMLGSPGVPDKLKELAVESGDLIKKINYPKIRTIYPTLSQAVFALSYLLAPWQIWMWKLILLFFDLLLLLLLILILRKLNLPAALVSVYWLNPMVIHEFFNAAHMDVLVILFVCLSIYLHLCSKTRLSIAILAIATGFKLWPIILLPLYLKPFWKSKKTFTLYLTGYLAIVLILFLPVLISNPDESLGFIRYAERWINNSAFYSIFREVIYAIITFTGLNINSAFPVPRIGIVILYMTILFLIIKREPADKFEFLEKALLSIAVLFIISPTQFPWYFTWIVPLLVLRPKVSLLLYSVTLPLYHLNYLSPVLVYIQHLPVLTIFLWEIISPKTGRLLYPEHL